MFRLIPASLIAATAFTQTIDIGSRRELFVDRYLVERMNNVRLELQKPIEKEVVLHLDQPWEGAFCGYFTVIHDGGRYRLYYRGVPNAGGDGRSDEVTCYAESRDGVHFTRPDLGIHTVRGATRNNVILAGMPPFSHNFAPFLDSKPGVPLSQRYKAIAGTGASGLAAFVSADGIHWSKLREEPVLPKGPARYDSQNLAFWSESESRYVCYFRTFKQVGSSRYRWITRTTSTDFVDWTPPIDMSFGDAPLEHLYTNQTSPYFRAPQLYVSIAARFFPGRQVLSDEDAKAIHVNPDYYKDVSDAVLFTTRGGERYDRTFLEAFVRPGVGMENWVSRTNYPAWNVVQTGPAEMSLYVNRNYGQPTAQLVRYAMRMDGFASAHAGYEGGEVVTKPLRFTGNQMEINFSTSAAGSVRVEIQDERGGRLAESNELIGDEIARNVRWKDGFELSRAAGRAVRLRFVMKDADLFAFRVH